MKTIFKGLNIGILAAMIVSLMISCQEPNGPNSDNNGSGDNNGYGVINIAAIQGLPAPAVGGTPVTEITANAQYTGKVVWSPAHSIFQNSTVYFATITLRAKNGYTLKGVKTDFFTVTGANRVNNDADSDVITVIFPRTAGTMDNPAVIDKQTIEGIAPLGGGIPKTTITPTAQYTGTITWSPADNIFKDLPKYTATITLAPKAGFTFNGVTANFFKVVGADTVSNNVNSNIITAVFTDIFVDILIDDLASYLAAQPDNTATMPYFIALNIGINDFSKLRTTLNYFPNKYVYIDLSGSKITTIPNEAFYSSVSYYYCTTLAGIIIPDSVTSIGDSAFGNCSVQTVVKIPDSVTSIGDW
jgi:hypothetical protein